MSERRLEREDIDSSLYRVRRMAVPQLVRMQMKTSRSAPLAANITNRLAT
jgi:hypothetical protein